MSPALAVSRALPEKALEGKQRHWLCLPTPAPTLFAGRARRVNAPLTWAAGDRTGDADDRPGSRAAPRPPSCVQHRAPRMDALRGPSASDDRSVWETRNQGLNRSSSSDCSPVGQFLKIHCLFLFRMVKITHVQVGDLENTERHEAENWQQTIPTSTRVSGPWRGLCSVSSQYSVASISDVMRHF